MKIAMVLMVALWSNWMAASPATAASGSSNAGPAATDSERTWDVLVLRDMMVPMRDGVKLATDLYVPARSGRLAEGRFPAVLLRTPYN